MKEYLISPAVVAVVSLLMFLLPAGAVLYAFQANAFLAGEWWRIASFPFVHVDWNHFTQNMIALSFSAALAFELSMSASAYSIIFAGANISLAILAIIFFPQTYLAGASFGVYAVMGGLGLQKNPYLKLPVLFGILSGVALIGLLSQTKSAFFHVLGFSLGSAIFLIKNTTQRKKGVFSAA